MSTAQSGSWFERRVNYWFEKDHLRISDRFGEFVAIIVISLVGWYFVSSQRQGTGFFTSSFGVPEQILFYLPIVLGIAISGVRILTGRRNNARLLEIVNAVATVAAAIGLYIVFPFNFAHLGDLLPSQIQFLVNWIPNYLARLVIVLCGIAGFVNIFYTSYLYLGVRRHLHSEKLQSEFERKLMA